MAELLEKRITRLKTRKQELRGEIKHLGDNPGRNSGHKIVMRKEEIARIDAKIKKLQGGES